MREGNHSSSVRKGHDAQQLTALDLQQLVVRQTEVKVLAGLALEWVFRYVVVMMVVMAAGFRARHRGSAGRNKYDEEEDRTNVVHNQQAGRRGASDGRRRRREEGEVGSGKSGKQPRNEPSLSLISLGMSQSRF